MNLIVDGFVACAEKSAISGSGNRLSALVLDSATGTVCSQRNHWQLGIRNLWARGPRPQFTIDYDSRDRRRIDLSFSLVALSW